MITKKQIEEFFASKKLAIAGVSRNTKKFGYLAYKHLKENGFDTYPINPHAELIDTDICYPGIAEVPDSADRLLILTHKEISGKLIEEAIKKGIKHIWVQQTSETPEIRSMANKKDLNIIYGKCIFMFAEPVKGIHKFHRNILKLFGALPK